MQTPKHHAVKVYCRRTRLMLLHNEPTTLLVRSLRLMRWIPTDRGGLKVGCFNHTLVRRAAGAMTIPDEPVVSHLPGSVRCLVNYPCTAHSYGAVLVLGLRFASPALLRGADHHQPIAEMMRVPVFDVISHGRIRNA